MDLLDDSAQQNLDIASFAQRHPQFFARVTRSIKCLPAEAGEGLRYILLTEYGLCDPEGHIANVSGKYDGLLDIFYLHKVDGRLSPIFDARLTKWTVNERFDAAIAKLCGLLAEYVLTARQQHNRSN